ncbi:hypothetical protein PQC39_gp046 [Vibrio phage Vp_R1]|uniref:Uncharacterized protein n=1 Tax=Vibrio phage Vp_R1 TaxID=2059867 RepID=A0A2H5BQ05_9CAUD|nr:hypothetical protein PQC39_gp046 [Vibrio phage Vp_R1]AUG88410.1 hypothetical protein VPR_046 [Vibrio phage Vp_R1]
MEIVNEETSGTLFGDLNPGEVFYYNGCYYMKLVMHESRNVANLQSGQVFRLYDDNVVTLFHEAKLVTGRHFNAAP